MKNDEIIDLWREEGDLERIQQFFNTINPDPDIRDRIKALTLQKIRDQEAKSVPAQEPSFIHSARFNLLFTGSAWPRIALSLAAVFLLIWLGKAGLSQLNHSSAPLQAASEPVHETASQASLAQPSEKDDPSSKQPEVNSSPSMTSPATTDSTALYSAPAPSTPSGLAAANAEVEEPEQNDTVNTARQPNSDGLAAEIPKAAAAPAENKALEPKASKIAQTIQLTLQTAQEDEAIKQISAALQTVGGYTQVSPKAGFAAKGRSPLLLKVPVSQLETFQASLSGIGRILSQDTVTQDLSVPYADAEKRLHDCETEEKRSLELLQAAQNTDERLQAQQKLDSLLAEMEQMKGQLQNWDEDLNFVTIELNF